MNNNQTLGLDKKDPRFIAAQASEQQLYEYYELKVKHHCIPLPLLGLKLRVTEICFGKPVVIVPGNSGDAFPLVPLMAQLRGRRILVINRPGGGLSEGLDHRTVTFRELRYKPSVPSSMPFSLQKVPIIGHSIGYHWTLWMALVTCSGWTSQNCAHGSSMNFSTPPIKYII